jgi:predicted membrane protein
MGKNDIPTDLEITIGSGNGSLTLTNQILDDLNINVGSGNISIDVSNVSLPKELALEVGSGDVSLSIPSDVGIEMDYTVGSGEIRFGEDLVFDKIGVWRSPSYQFMDNKIRIEVTVGSGQVTVQTK